MPGPSHLAPSNIVGGEYELLRPIAEGGMGAVYVALERSTGIERALKLMHPHLLGDETSRARFEREAKASAAIDSDHVVQIVGAGIDRARGIPWIAMEMLEGETLEAHVEAAGPFDPREAIPILEQIVHALGAAHRAGLVHRDLKPANVMLTKNLRADGSPFVKLLDFGIAKVIQEAQAAVTSTNAVGSPYWMAPEQSDKKGKISARTDVWAFGLMTFWMLTGRLFWRSDHDGGGPPIGYLLRQMLVEPLPPPSVRASELRLSEPLPLGFDRWFEGAVARDPKARFPDAEATLHALLPVLRDVGGAPSPFLATRAFAGRAALAAATLETGVATGPASFDRRAPSAAPPSPAAPSPAAPSPAAPMARDLTPAWGGVTGVDPPRHAPEAHRSPPSAPASIPATFVAPSSPAVPATVASARLIERASDHGAAASTGAGGAVVPRTAPIQPGAIPPVARAAAYARPREHASPAPHARPTPSPALSPGAPSSGALHRAHAPHGAPSRSHPGASSSTPGAAYSSPGSYPGSVPSAADYGFPSHDDPTLHPRKGVSAWVLVALATGAVAVLVSFAAVLFAFGHRGHHERPETPVVAPPAPAPGPDPGPVMMPIDPAPSGSTDPTRPMIPTLGAISAQP